MQPAPGARLPRRDTASAATGINDRGQLVGISGTCDNAVGRFSARRAVMWEDGAATDLGSLGGIAWVTPTAINRRGDVVGFSNLNVSDGGSFRAQAFLWTRSGGMQPLGTLPGDVYSQGLGIDQRGQVVGTSCTAGFASCRAFLWQAGAMVDLNERARLGSDDALTTANDIDELGVATGVAVDEAGTQRTFLALPIPGLPGPRTRRRALGRRAPVRRGARRSPAPARARQGRPGRRADPALTRGDLASVVGARSPALDQLLCVVVGWLRATFPPFPA